VNQDGYGDIVVGAFLYGESTSGRAYVFHGSAHGLESTPATILEEPRVGASWASWFGESVAGGDFDGDGFGDVAIGAKSTPPGYVFTFMGSPMGVSTKPVNVLTGTSTTEAFGETLALAGDVNGDGYADLLVGTNPGFGGHGHGYVYAGGPSGLVATPTATLLPAKGYFSASVSAAGDVNADGYSDVLVGVSDQSTVGVYLGGPTGPSSTPVSLLTSSDVYQFGFSLGRAGDITHGLGDPSQSAEYCEGYGPLLPPTAYPNSKPSGAG
jgi:hypothetical protein